MPALRALCMGREQTVDCTAGRSCGSATSVDQFYPKSVQCQSVIWIQKNNVSNVHILRNPWEKKQRRIERGLFIYSPKYNFFVFSYFTNQWKNNVHKYRFFFVSHFLRIHKITFFHVLRTHEFSTVHNNIYTFFILYESMNNKYTIKQILTRRL